MHSIKRLHNEILEIYKTRQDFTIVYNKNSIDFIIVDRLKIVLNNHYPFRVPTLYILKRDLPYEISYINSLKAKSIRILKYLEYLYDGCICCKTMLNHVNWSPTYHIEKILQEIEIYNDIKRTIKYHIMLDDILCKYLLRMPNSNISNYFAEYAQIGLSANIKMYIISYLDITNIHLLPNKNFSLCSFRTKDKMKSLGFTYIG